MFINNFRFLLKKGPTRPLFHLLLSFETHYKFYNFMYVKKFTSSIRYRDLNSRFLDDEPPPITTRPRLVPKDFRFLLHTYFPRNIFKYEFIYIWTIIFIFCLWINNLENFPVLLNAMHGGNNHQGQSWEKGPFELALR